jgi:hypothetical protein
MSANASRMRKPSWARSRTQHSETPAGANGAKRSLAYGTVLATAPVGPRLVAYRHAQAGLWCQDAEGASIGVISWGHLRTPSLQFDPADRLAEQLHGAEAEVLVRAGMNAWRHLFEGQRLDPALHVRVNPDLAHHARSGRSADAGR